MTFRIAEPSAEGGLAFAVIEPSAIPDWGAAEVEAARLPEPEHSRIGQDLNWMRDALEADYFSLMHQRKFDGFVLFVTGGLDEEGNPAERLERLATAGILRAAGFTQAGSLRHPKLMT